MTIYYITAVALAALMFLIYVVQYNRHSNINITLLFLLIPFSNLAKLLLYQSVNIEEALAANKFYYISTILILLFTMLATMSLCDIKFEPHIKLTIFIVTAAVSFCTMQIGRNDLYYKNPHLVRVGSGVVIAKEYGVLHKFFLLFAFLVLISAILAVVYAFRKKKQFSKKYILLVLLPGVISFVSVLGAKTFLKSFGLFQNDELAPATFDIMLGIYLVISRRLVLYNISDTVIDTVVENGNTGLISFDTKLRYLGSNEIAKEFLPELKELTVDKRIVKSGQTEKFIYWLDSFVNDQIDRVTYEKDGSFYIVIINYLMINNTRSGVQLFITDDTKNQKILALERERAEAEIKLASKIQNSVLPHDFPAFPDRTEFDLYAVMNPAKGVGGDFYDYFLIDEDHLCMVISDVSGKGVPAALFMMESRVTLHSFAMSGKSPGEILSLTNDALCSNNQADMFVTSWIGVLEISSGRLTASNAGHEYPVIKQKGGSFELYKDIHGFVVGGMSGMKYREYTLELEPGSILYVYTDGVPEAENENHEMFGTEKLCEALNRCDSMSPEELINTVRLEISGFVKEAEQFDDITMLCLEYKGG